MLVADTVESLGDETVEEGTQFESRFSLRPQEADGCSGIGDQIGIQLDDRTGSGSGSREAHLRRWYEARRPEATVWVPTRHPKEAREAWWLW